ncbi:MAG: hypothetical protein IPK30_08545 [Cellvibrionales bacterium]|nr:hypothetical protein [Cellvibrionales bacterium]
MKKTSIITAAVASFSLMSASTAFSATQIEVTGTVNQSLAVSGCKTLSTPIQASVVFDDDGTYSITDTNASTTVLKGTWFKLAGKSPTTYTVYMTPDVFAPAPDDPDVVASLDPTIPPPAGTLDDFLDSLQAAVGGMTCKIKTGGTQSVTFVQPSTLIKKNTLVVKNGVGTLNISVSGSQLNDFSGPPKPGKFAKPGKFSATLAATKVPVVAP